MAGGDTVLVKIRSRNNVSTQTINIGDINNTTQVGIGADAVSSFGLLGSNRHLKFYAGTSLLGDVVFVTGNVLAGTDIEKVRFKQTGEAVFNDPKRNYNFRVSAAVNESMVVVSASTNQIGIRTQPTSEIHSSGSIKQQGNVDITGTVYSTRDQVVSGTTFGLVLQSPDGTYWRFQVTNSGSIFTNNLGPGLPAG